MKPRQGASLGTKGKLKEVTPKPSKEIVPPKPKPQLGCKIGMMGK